MKPSDFAMLDKKLFEKLLDKLNPAPLFFESVFNKYKFTYTSKDVSHFNNYYYKRIGYFPFTDTRSISSNLEDTDINTNDIKKFYKYAMESYNNISEFSTGNNISINNSQATIYNNEDEIIISFRGTEDPSTQDGLQDWLTNTTLDIKLASNLGWLGLESENDDVMVHYGYNQYVDILFNEILENHILENIEKDIYIVGHSLGSIAAQIFAYRLFLEMRFRGYENNIKGVWGYGGVKGLYSPTNVIDNYLNVYSVFHRKDPVPYWYPIFGDSLGTKIILNNNKGNYEIYKRDIITPYIGINLGNSTKYFNELKYGGDLTTYRYITKSFFDSITVGKYFRDIVSNLTYPQGDYSLALTKEGDVNEHSANGGYDVSIGNLEDNLYISKNKLLVFDNHIQPQITINYDIYDKHLFDENISINENKNHFDYSLLNTQSTNLIKPKILGYVLNYNPNMRHSKIIF